MSTPTVVVREESREPAEHEASDVTGSRQGLQVMGRPSESLPTPPDWETCKNNRSAFPRGGPVGTLALHKVLEKK